MPFMRGAAPIRRTKLYLERGKLFLNNKLKILSINYNTEGDHHQGARDFAFWYFPQIQFRNPNVQMVSFKEITPTPFIRCFYEDGKELLIDIDGKTKEEILAHCFKTIGKPLEQVEAEVEQAKRKENPSHFGYGCERSCICLIPGQVPCSGLVKLPDHMRGKWRMKNWFDN